MSLDFGEFTHLGFLVSQRHLGPKTSCSLDLRLQLPERQVTPRACECPHAGPSSHQSGSLTTPESSWPLSHLPHTWGSWFSVWLLMSQGSQAKVRSTPKAGVEGTVTPIFRWACLQGTWEKHSKIRTEAGSQTASAYFPTPT